MVRQGGIDAYVKVQFAGEKPLTTRTVSTKGSDVEFQQVRVHIHSFVIELFQHFWSNLYGAPEDSRLLQFNSKNKADMNTRPDTASTYRGRVLLSLRVESNVKNTLEIPHTRNLLSKTPSPPTQNFTLRAFILSGTEIPAFSSKMRFGQNSRMSVRVCCGSTTLWTARVDNVKGLCQWNEYLESANLLLPSDLSQAPDVFVYLVHGAVGPVASNICYARYKAADLINTTGRIPSIVFYMVCVFS
ncbi:hypothetical protein DYB37_010080 [Aphanomyces astaci]|uniref:C2 domain-containing protein n=1 Tax=Aphanomyces astaci TaxID=112090 RepID=A0A3R7A4Q1_APHAT|nr:hypothetical protein DYB37_010080 [Aphanomyces astaci]